MDRITLDAFIASEGLQMRVTPALANPSMADSANMTHWRCTISKSNQHMVVIFSMGSAHNGQPPTLADVLDCLASDSSSVDQSTFDDWCDEMGWGAYSRKARSTYLACERQAKALKRVLGDEAYDTLLYHTERL